MKLKENKNTLVSTSVKIGIPRVLNMYENYPFWQTLFTECGLEVVLSPETTYEQYQKGVGSIMSDNICFPAKVAHGHILALVDAQVDRIFYPIIPKESKEFDNTSNSFNCPVVSGYPEVIRSAMNPKENFNTPFDKPVITFSNEKALKQATYNYISQFNIAKKTFDKAFKQASATQKIFRDNLIEPQREILDRCLTNNELVFIVAGRPYHADSLIHQKAGQILSDLGVNVLTDDVFRIPESTGFARLNMVSQWSYPNRVVQTALEVAKLPPNVQMVQLNSFGCGPDSFLMEEIGNILKKAGKNHTVLRIDEISSPGSIRLRLRSLIESLKARQASETAKYAQVPSTAEYSGYNAFFGKEDKQKIVLIPWFTDFLSPFIPVVAELAGYKFVNCPKTSKQSAEIGLKYGNNEVCYPATLVLGDLIAELKTGKYDLNNVAVAITQTGGQCRATNYLAQIKLGLKNAGFSNIPTIAVSLGSSVFQNRQDGFEMPVRKILNIALHAFLFGDSLNKMYSSTIVREKNKGQTQQLFDFYMDKAKEFILENNAKKLMQLLEQAVDAFNLIEIEDRKLEKVGLIGEIFVKYNNYGQAHITEWLRQQNMEVEVPPMIDFFLQTFINREINNKNGITHSSYLMRTALPFLKRYLNKRIEKVERITRNYRFYEQRQSIFEIARQAAEVIDLSNQFGEGWMIAGEVAAFSHKGINRVVCVQPFGCIANHVVAKGIERRIKRKYPKMNLLYLDIDGGMAEVNLQNRLKFLID